MKALVPSILVLCAGVGVAVSFLADAGAKPAVLQEAPVAGPEHARWQKLTGTWDAVIVSHDMTGAEQRTKGTMTSTKHTDFHTVDSFDGTFMGMPFLGHGVNGYCQVKQQYFTFWTDSMTPSPVYLTGDYDATKRELSMKGECFGMSGKLEPCRTLTRYTDDDHYVWAMYGAGPDGKEMQFIAIEYSRKK